MVILVKVGNNSLLFKLKIMIKNSNKLKENLFDLTPAQKEKSIQIYGKVIKCLVAPYHTINTIPLESNNTVYVYPERDLTITQRKELLSIMVNSPKDEICFVTSDLFIILDMIKDCVRIMNPEGDISEPYENTFGANPHTIIYSILQNSKNDASESKYKNIINKLITDINNGLMSKSEYDKNIELIDTIGEPIISTKLKEMMGRVKIVQK